VGLIFISSHGLLRRAGGGGFDSVRLLLLFFFPLACLVLGQLLIASEFRQKTQLFLDGLPLPRWRMLAVKFGLGFLLMLLAAVMALAYVTWSARGTEAITLRFAALLLAKSSGWTAFLYTLCFAHAFLGRYRLFFGVAVLAGLVYCSILDLPIAEFGPFALIDFRFAYERFTWPTTALAITAGFVLLLTAVGFSLGLVRDATVAALLAEKMSAREKVFLTLCSLVVLFVSGEVYDRRKTFTPVQMPGAAEARHGAVHVLASAAVDAPSREETAALQRTADAVAAELGALTDYLGCNSYPPIFIVHRRDLAAKDLVHGDLKWEQGLLVRANLTAKDFKIDALQEWLLRESLGVHTSGLADRERNAWAFDALQWWWPRSQHGTRTALDEAVQVEHATPTLPAFTPAEIRTWFSVRKTIGEDKADALAGSSLAVLAARHGLAGVQRFFTARFGGAEPNDVRAWWHDLIRPTPVRLRAATGVNEETVAADWRAAMTARP
jgi:hypothetical protein